VIFNFNLIWNSVFGWNENSVCAFSSLEEKLKQWPKRRPLKHLLLMIMLPCQSMTKNLDRRQIEFNLWWEIEGNDIFQNSRRQAPEFLPQHTNTVPPPSEVEKALVKIWKGVVCKNQLNPLILNSPFTSARTSHFWGGRMKKAKDPVFFKVAGNSIFCVLHIFLSRIVCFLLANVILFVNINPSRWGTLNYDWGGREYKKHSKYQYCPESSNRTHHLPIKKTFQPAIIRSVCHFH